jgi:hypothetical protein
MTPQPFTERMAARSGYTHDSVTKIEIGAVQIFGENLKRKEVDDSHGLSRAAEIAREFGARR